MGRAQRLSRQGGRLAGVARPGQPAGAPGAHHEGGTRMCNDPRTSVVNRYGQSWDIPNLFVIGSSTFPTMSGFMNSFDRRPQVERWADADHETPDHVRPRDSRPTSRCSHT